MCKSGKTEPVTAVAFADSLYSNKLVLGIGTESGHIEVWAVPTEVIQESAGPTLLHSVPVNDSHFYTVNKLAWRPLNGTADKNTEKVDLTLASCGEDCGVRIFDFMIKRS